MCQKGPESFTTAYAEFPCTRHQRSMKGERGGEMISRRHFLATTGVAVATTSIAVTAHASPVPASTGGERSAKLFLPEDDLKPAAFDRLPLEWHKQRAQKLREKLAEDGYTGILLTDRWNIIYFTGLWHTTTERLVNVFLPLKAEPVWFNAALDRDLVNSWWYSDGEMYFDWFHAEGAFPNEGKVQMGAKVDLFEWMLKALKKRGYADQKLAADVEFTPSAQRKVLNVLGKEMSSAEETCMKMRMKKTPEELALTRRAYNYFNQMHAFARDMLLEHGTDLTDYDIASAATKYGTDLDRKSTRLNSSHGYISYAVFCLKKKTTTSPPSITQSAINAQLVLRQ